MTDTDKERKAFSDIRELKPCPYVNGFTADNSKVSWFLKDFGDHFDFIVLKDDKPDRCFRFTRAEQPGLREVAEIKSITLGENYIGKITEQEAVDLVNEVIRSQLAVINGDCEIVTDIDGDLETQAIESALNTPGLMGEKE